MKSVLLCVPSLATGGSERFAVDLAKRIDKTRYKVSIAETRNSVESSFKRDAVSSGIEVIDLSGTNYFVMLKKQFLYFHKAKPDVVHANTGSVLHIMLTCMLFNIRKRIYTVHNEAKLLHYGNRFKKLVYKLAFTLFRFTPVAICPTVKETIVNDFNLPEAKIPVVNNGVDTERYLMREKTEAGEELRLITVASLYWIKNQQMTINAVCDLRKAGYHVVLTLVGDGQDRDKIQELINNRSANDFIKMVGKKSNVSEYLLSSDVYISSSKTEGLPLSILEAMSSGLPVIATNAGGTKDIVHDGINGLLIPVDDIEALKKSIMSICDNKNLYSSYSIEARKTAEEWNVNRCSAGYMALYEG